MKSKLFDILVWLITITFIGILMTLPESIPLHWDYNWKVTGYGSKYTMLFIMLLPLIFYYLMSFLMNSDPKKKSFGERKKTYELMRKFITVFLILMVIFFVYMAKNPNADGMIILLLLLGVMYMGIGNYFPKIPQNYFMGIKTPWTLANETVWKKTHLIGGYVFVVVGMLCILCAITAFEHSFLVVIIGTIGEVVITVGYSYYIFKKIGQQEDEKC